MIFLSVRGGSYFTVHRFLLNTDRYGSQPEVQSGNYGFRLIIRREA